MWILTIDGGGSKTLARLTNSSNGASLQQQAGPASLTNNFELAILHIRQLTQALCQQAAIDAAELVTVIGLAGAGNLALQQQAYQILSPDYRQLLLTTDARTSLFGANLGQPVVVVALGTGSVAMRLQADGKEVQVGGWGFNIGDEGGGAWLGKQAVRQLLWEIDNGSIHSLLSQAVASQLGSAPVTLLPWLKKATPADFATLAPLILEYAAVCPQAKAILQQQASEVQKLAHTAMAGQTLPLVLLGGLSSHILPYLPQQLTAQLQQAKGNALDGGLLLAQQLSQPAHVAGA